MYNISPILLHFVQNCCFFFTPNNLEIAGILLGQGNCQCVCVVEQTVTNFLFLFSPVPFLYWQWRPWGSAFSPSTRESLENQTAPGPHAKICDSCLWYFKTERMGARKREKTCSELWLLFITYWEHQYLHVSAGVSMYTGHQNCVFPECGFFLLMRRNPQRCEI